MLLLMFFFFQADDGIRDYKVTGVQTCALPIFIAEDLPESKVPLLCESGKYGNEQERKDQELFYHRVKIMSAENTKEERSEERRVGKERRRRGGREQERRRGRIR